MQKLLVINDIHITEAGRTVFDVDPLEQFKSVVNSALEVHEMLRRRCFLGDLAHSSLPAEYSRLCEALTGLTILVIPMLGNNDLREPFLNAFPRAPQTNSGHVQAVVDFGPLSIIALDTLDGPRYDDRHRAGALCSGRQTFLEGT